MITTSEKRFRVVCMREANLLDAFEELQTALDYAVERSDSIPHGGVLVSDCHHPSGQVKWYLPNGKELV